MPGSRARGGGGDRRSGFRRNDLGENDECRRARHAGTVNSCIAFCPPGRRRRRPRQPKSRRTVHTAMSIAARSAVSPAGTAWRVRRMFTAPKYTAIT